MKGKWLARARSYLAVKEVGDLHGGGGDVDLVTRLEGLLRRAGRGA